jgi:hypothetical protein
MESMNSKKKASPSLGLPSAASLTPQKLEELTNHVVNRLSPSNIRRTATDFIKDWEKSLAEPIDANSAVSVMPAATNAEEDKENRTV